MANPPPMRPRPINASSASGIAQDLVYRVVRLETDMESEKFPICAFRTMRPVWQLTFENARKASRIMRALTVVPGVPNSARLDDIPEPLNADGAVLVQTLMIGVSGTDRDIVSGRYGSSPPGRERLVLGHESLGRVLSAPAESSIVGGDLVVGIVRRPDPVPCSACACGEWDMCRNGLYTERGIKHRNGYGAERFRVEPEFTIALGPTLGDVGVLLEPTSIAAKAWDHIDRIVTRSRCWRPQVVLVSGAGPVGLLAQL